MHSRTDPRSSRSGDESSTRRARFPSPRALPARPARADRRCRPGCHPGRTGQPEAAGRHRGRTRVAWSLVGVSALSWATGESVWSYYQLRLGQPVPFPSVADAGFLGAVPFAVLGVLLFPAAPAQAASRLGALLDGLIIAGSLLVVSWATVLGTVYRGGSGSLLSQAIGLAYPIGDVIIATIALLLVRRAPRDGRGPLLLLAAGLLANLVADSSFALLTTANAYGPVQASDTGWVAGYLLIGLAAHRGCHGPLEAA